MEDALVLTWNYSFLWCPDKRAEALEHLNFAIGEFRKMKMQPYLGS
jgi:hypothetical protein